MGVGGGTLLLLLCCRVFSPRFLDAGLGAGLGGGRLFAGVRGGGVVARKESRGLAVDE